MTHAAPNRLHHLRTRARAPPRQAIYIDHDIKICTASNRTTLTPNNKIKLYDYINYVKIIVEFYITNKNIAKVYINMVFRRRRQKPRRRRDLRSPSPPTTRPAAAVIFDRRRRLRQDLPPLQNRCRRRLKTRRRRRIPTAAA
jgi:hypothetical protein